MTCCRYLLFTILLAAGCVSNPEPYSLPESEAVTTEELVRLPTYTEGIVFDEVGNAYVSEGMTGVITRITPQGETETWLTLEGAVGHKILPDGTHLVCDYKMGAVLHISAEGEVLSKVAEEFNNQSLKQPNDLTLDEINGGFYFTDSGGTWPEPTGSVYHIDGKGAITLLADSLGYPNGIALDAERKRLYVAESVSNRILVFPVLSPGKIGLGELFIELPEATSEEQWNVPDGMILDEQGNLLIAHLGMSRIQVVNPSGELIRSYDTKILGPTNVAQLKSEDSVALYVVGSVGLPPRETEGALVRIDF